jgi:hypothetical protein
MEKNKEKRKELDISDYNKELGVIKFPRSQAQADYKISKKKIIRKDGTFFYKKTTTTNDEKIADACVQIFQQSNLALEFDYEKLREKAEGSLFNKFTEHNLIIKEEMNSKQKQEVEKKQEIAISQFIRNHIENNLDLTFEVDFDKFVEMTGVKSASRIGNALKMLEEVQTKASYEYKTPIISEDFSTIEYELTKVSTIPSISLILDEEMGERFNTIGEYAESDIKNKKKHIKGVKFDINKSYLSSVLGLGRDYTSTDRKDRNNFNSSYSYRLDILIKSIEKVQHIPKFNRFTFEEIQKKFGTQFKDYRNFKRRVLVPSISDINEYTLLNVELIEYRSSKEIDTISFKINRKICYDKKTKFGVDKTAFYIASRLFYFSTQKIDNLLAFAKHIEKSFNSLDLIIYDGKYINEWKTESDNAIEAEIEIMKFIDNHLKLLEQKGLYYDEKRMCIVEKYIESKNAKENDFTPTEKIRIIKTADYKVTDPFTSLRYLHEIIKTEGETISSIIDYLPFQIPVSNGWKSIETVSDYVKYQDNIKLFIYDKKIDYFRFDENSVIEEIFKTNIIRGNFSEINNDFREMVKKLSR